MPRNPGLNYKAPLGQGGNNIGGWGDVPGVLDMSARTVLILRAEAASGCDYKRATFERLGSDLQSFATRGITNPERYAR